MVLFLLGLVLALGRAPGADAFATGPKVGIIMVSWTLAALLVGIPATQWFLRRTTRPGDYEGRCPVGESCPRCEAFNLKPRTRCRVCGDDLPLATAQAGTEQAARL